MAGNGKVGNRDKTREASNQTRGTGRRDRKDRQIKKKGWSDVFDKLTYSSGPGDNIYVFG